MKFFPSLLFLLVVFSLNTLFAQAYPQHYRIGTLENPVTAAEYCTFLNQNDRATDDAYIYDSKYFYDQHLMAGSDAVIIRSTKKGWLANSYDYTVRVGCENQIIEDLESEIADRFFLRWKSHLSIGELCNYINQWIIEESYFYGDPGVSFEEKVQAANERRNMERQAQVDSKNYYKHHKKFDLEKKVEFYKIYLAVKSMIETGQQDQDFLEKEFYESRGWFTTVSGFEKGRKLITVSPEGPSQRLVARVADGVSEYDRPAYGLWFEE